MAHGLSKLVLLAISALGFYTLWAFPARNGLLKHLADLSEVGALMPGASQHTMKQTYVGIKLIDDKLTTLVGFFLTAVDGARLDISLSYLNLGLQVLAAWCLVMMESLRVGNSGRLLITSITVFGLCVVVIGWACVAPIWFAIHLHTSATVSDPSRTNIMTKSNTRLLTIIPATLVGFGLPSVLTGVPAPALISYDSKQNWVAVLQGWPLWITLAQLGMVPIALLFGVAGHNSPVKEGVAQRIKYTRRICTFAILCSTTGHLLPWAALLFRKVLPGLFSEAHRAQLEVYNIYRAPNPFGAAKAASVADGALWFLQWDLYLGVTATFLWGCTVLIAAKPSRSRLNALTTCLKYAAVALITGPSGAAVLAVRHRDEEVSKEAAKQL